MMYKIAVCDDEHNQIEYLSALIKAWAEHGGRTVSIRSFSSAEEFLFYYEEEGDWDILLLDIEMKGLSGVELAKKVREGNDDVQIVFITGYSDFIAEGYEVAALHYLMKPVSREKLSEVLDRATAKLHKKGQAILIRSGKENQRIPVDSIVYIEVQAHTVFIHTTDKEYETKLSISGMEEMLDEGFIRCHRSYMAGIGHIARITKSDVVFDDGRKIPLARSAYNMVNQAFIRYYKGEI